MNDVTSARKERHIEANIIGGVGAKGITPGFERYRFENNPLPELDLSEVDTRTTFLGWRLQAPLLISCMTGGAERATEINRRLAAVAQAFGFAMGLGSGRALLEDPEALVTFDVRPIAPDVPLLANLGAVQLKRGYGIDDCRRLIDTLQADALVLHLNPLQEALQRGGDTEFAGLLFAIEALCKELARPVIVKEVGWGIPPDVSARLFDAGVSAIDVAGAGGTSWSEVEGMLAEEPWRANVARAFGGWGIPTAECILANRAAAPFAALIASGGIGNGIDAAKALALGADVVGIAGPFLRAVDRGEVFAMQLARELTETLRVAMFALGHRSVAELQATTRLVRI